MSPRIAARGTVDIFPVFRRNLLPSKPLRRIGFVSQKLRRADPRLTTDAHR
jgi:hypothetical protein